MYLILSILVAVVCSASIGIDLDTNNLSLAVVFHSYGLFECQDIALFSNTVGLPPNPSSEFLKTRNHVQSIVVLSKFTQHAFQLLKPDNWVIWGGNRGGSTPGPLVVTSLIIISESLNGLPGGPHKQSC
jgi:hypothetical protein